LTTLLFDAQLGTAETAVLNTIDQLQQHNISTRIRQHDHTVWRPDPTEITNRLGWLDIANRMQSETDRLQATVQSAQAAGFRHVLLLGMGGSSLAPELFAKTFTNTGGLSLAVVDSTDPDMIRSREASVDLQKTLFIVATKSGGTVETLSAFKYFYNRVAEFAGQEAGRHFIAITDPGSSLVAKAEQYRFREVYLNDPNIGGRYSALSFFGLVPAALTGLDVPRLLAQAVSEAAKERGTQFGAVMGTMHALGRDKLTLVTSPQIASFADWAEQLIAESTGKDGKGILPVAGEPLLAPEFYGDDRYFVHLRLAGDSSHEVALQALAQAGFPVVVFELADVYELGAHFWLWEMATAVAGHLLGIQPFDQPNVEAAKVQARKMVAAYKETGKLPEGETAPVTAVALQQFLTQAQPNNYIAIQAYVNPTPQTDALLQTLRRQLLSQTRLATTVGYGPRFLHSTGQLHKGDGGIGLFIQLTSEPENDLPIPDEAGETASSMTFGILKLAQALGDAKALQEVNRRLIRFHLGKDVLSGLNNLLSKE